MNKPREFWIWTEGAGLVTGQNKFSEHKDAIHVREVIPGTITISQQEYESLKDQLAWSLKNEEQYKKALADKVGTITISRKEFRAACVIAALETDNDATFVRDLAFEDDLEAALFGEENEVGS